MTPQTTYTVKSRQDGYVWQFTYDLNGNLMAFKILDGQLTGKQMKWLFSNANFPAIESVIKTVWIPSLKKNFDIEIGEPDVSFEAFWIHYNLKRHKVRSQKLWEKMSKANKIKAIKALKAYDGYLHRKKIEKMLPSTYLQNESWEDEFNAIH